MSLVRGYKKHAHLKHPTEYKKTLQLTKQTKTGVSRGHKRRWTRLECACCWMLSLLGCVVCICHSCVDKSIDVLWICFGFFYFQVAKWKKLNSFCSLFFLFTHQHWKQKASSPWGEMCEWSVVITELKQKLHVDKKAKTKNLGFETFLWTRPQDVGSADT